MKKTSRNITHAESRRRPRLRLAKEAVRTLRIGDLAAVHGGEACVTTSWTTDKQTQGAKSKAC